MSLATRCAACGTVFRVVQDQLKVSEGWVRCGRCGDVFNALEGLFDLERESAPAWTPSQRGGLDLLPASAHEHAVQAEASATQVARSDGEPEAAATSDAAGDTEIDTRTDSQLETRQDERDEDDDVVGRGEVSEFDDAAAEGPPNVDAMPEPTPAFLREAHSRARWQRPGLRAALSVAATLLGVLLAGQAVFSQRDAIAARWPPAAPALALLCAALDCRIEPLRHIEGLAVESSGLTQLDNASLYRLQVSLRNRDALPLLTPALDVTLTDSRGEVVSRKVLTDRDFGVPPLALVAAGAELTLQTVLDAGERRITGYSIEIFYP